MRVERSTYLKRLVDRMDNGSVKVVAGVRRCGKSYLLNQLFRDHLLANGVPEERVVTVALDDVRDEKYLDPRRLYDRLAAAAAEGHTYAIIDEIQLIENFTPLVNGLLRLDGLDLLRRSILTTWWSDMACACATTSTASLTICAPRWARSPTPQR